MIANNYAKNLIQTNNKMNNRNIHYNKLTKQELINIILNKNKLINKHQKSTRPIHRSVKENIIQPPIEFQDKPMIENIIQPPIQFQDKQILTPRTKINVEKMVQKYEDIIKKSIQKKPRKPK